ncbi:type II toxin-antitoxin system VapB family antitoxin [Dyadobacter sp. CY345]|uniref:type II toxin-antitoxin system VapB family antitoxin n=1 Tax=Dyadobacter sp. CY345 TaxID=2909335 RepID=UPI001F390E68|nr:type II toxin-antitoxin system VapB family antitoxin [Dyadobacter sp. CY345]MCF2442929.1 type II toxin-antitoxin system VapB family antitoxin [Dyadobacter sp. CY345]
MRTNVEIDDSLMEEAMQLTQIKTKKQIIESALKEFIAATHRKQLMSLRGKVEWEGNLDDMRIQDVQSI